MIRSSSLVSALGSLMVLVGASVGATGCEASFYADPVYAEAGTPVVWVAAAPVVYIETYPAYLYGGETCYYVEGRCYYRDHDRWAYYRDESRVEMGRWRANAHVAVDASYHGGYHGSAGGSYGGGQHGSHSQGGEQASNGAPPARGEAPPEGHPMNVQGSAAVRPGTTSVVGATVSAKRRAPATPTRSKPQN